MKTSKPVPVSLSDKLLTGRIIETATSYTNNTASYLATELEKIEFIVRALELSLDWMAEQKQRVIQLRKKG